MQADRAQERNVAAEHPAIVADLRRRYEAWWATVAPRLRDFVPISLGAPEENPVLLTSSDWQDAYADNAKHIRQAAGGPRGGPWNVHIERDGEYEFTLRRWPPDLDAPLAGTITPPGKAMPIAAARLTIAGHDRTAAAGAEARDVVFRVPLAQGRAQLQAWFQDPEGRDLCGAFFVRAMRLPP
jgi:arylsulfatase